jgi:hypothetical protein
LDHRSFGLALALLLFRLGAGQKNKTAGFANLFRDADEYPWHRTTVREPIAKCAGGRRHGDGIQVARGTESIRKILCRAGQRNNGHGLAYLHGLYKMGSDKSLLFQQNDIADRMKETPGGQ